MTTAVAVLNGLLVFFWTIIIKLVAAVVYTVLLVCLIAIFLCIAATCVVYLDKPREEPHGP